MKTFQVSVERKLYVTGHVKVLARDEFAALRTINNKIAKGTLQTTDVEWGEPEYEDHSFDTTGDVDLV
jgi:predicted transglutaminase-like cysteine proteinase